MKKQTIFLRGICLSLMSFMIFTGISGCGKKEKADKTDDVQISTEQIVEKHPEQEQQQEISKENGENMAPVTILSDLEAEITWWTYPVFVQAEGEEPGTYEQEIIADFRRQYPNIHVEVEVLDYETGPAKVQAAIAEGKVPDLLLDAPSRIMDYAKAGVLADVTELFTEERKSDLVSQDLLTACKYGDQYMMYPLSMSNYVMAFNKEMLETTGAIDLLKREGNRAWNTETFEMVLEKLNYSGFQAGSLYCSGVAGDYAIRSFLTNLYDVPLMAEDLGSYGFTGERAVKTLKKAKEWVDKSWILNGSGETGAEAVEAFVNGEASFTLLWSLPHRISYQKQLEENGIRVVEMPYPSEDGVPSLEYVMNGFCVFKQEKEDEEQAARYLAEFICNGALAGKHVARTGGMPVYTSLGDVYQGNEEALFYQALTPYSGPYYQKVKGFEPARVYWYQMISEVLNGEYEAADAIESFIEYANETLTAQ